MILAKAPMRVSFFGGGSDIPSHYLKYSGSTLSMAIDKYVYVAVSHTPHSHIKLSYAKQEIVTDIKQIQNEIVRNTLQYFNIYSNIEINSFAEIPTIGTGLGGSSAFTCALIRALAAYSNISMNAYDIAETACKIEIDMCKWNIGKQDQYASAFGGMNHITYNTDNSTMIRSINPNNIDDYMILIPTLLTRHATNILTNIDFKKKRKMIKKLANQAEKYSYYTPDFNLYSTALNEAWNIKKQLEPSISNSNIDSLYEKCFYAGAQGAKLLGAGGGGYILALTDNISGIKEYFYDRVCLNIKVAEEGAKVVYRD